MAKKSFTIYLDEEVYAQLQQLAKARRWSVNVLVNWMIEQVIVRLGPPASGK